jgi:hypothetical protein
MPYQSTDALGPKSEVEVDIRSDQAPFRPHITQEDLTQNSVYLFLWSLVDLFCFVLFSV